MAGNKRKKNKKQDVEVAKKKASASQSSRALVAKPVKKLSNSQIVMNGIHLFCGVPILSIPYAAKEGGWCGIFLFGMFCAFAFFSSYLLGLCFDANPTLRTYSDVGYFAYGAGGRVVVWVIEFILTYASTIESTIIVKDILKHIYPEVISKFGTHGFITSGGFIAFLFILVTFFMLLFYDIGILDPLFTGLGVILTILLVGSLFWLRVVVGVGYELETTRLLNFSTLPMAIGFYAYCFAGHPYLPEGYHSLNDKKQYNVILIYIFLPTLVLYTGAIMGYALFGSKIEAVFVLNMPLNFIASYVVIVITVIHQIIRYFFGVYSMARTLDEIVTRLNLNDLLIQVLGIVIRLFLVISTIPFSIMVPAYGPFMAFVGSLFGIFVSLIIPCVCFLKIRKGHVTRIQRILTQTILATSFVAAGFGIWKSSSEMAKG